MRTKNEYVTNKKRKYITNKKRKMSRKKIKKKRKIENSTYDTRIARR